MVIYRDSKGRFSKEQNAVFKKSGDRLFVRLFGVWAEAKPVTTQSLRESMARYDRAIQKALASA
jgi:hypothetical protein